MCVSRFAEFTFLHVLDLEVVLHYLQFFPVEASIIIAPYLVSIVILPVFILCGYGLNQNGFFRVLFEKAIDLSRANLFPGEIVLATELLKKHLLIIR